MSPRVLTIAMRNPDGPGERAEEQALGEQLPDESHATGAERRAHRELLAPRGASGEGQVRHVRAGDQHEHQHRAQHHQQRTPDVAHHLVTQGTRVESPRDRGHVVAVRKRGLEARRDGRQVDAYLLD